MTKTWGGNFKNRTKKLNFKTARTSVDIILIRTLKNHWYFAQYFILSDWFCILKEYLRNWCFVQDFNYSTILWQKTWIERVNFFDVETVKIDLYITTERLKLYFEFSLKQFQILMIGHFPQIGQWIDYNCDSLYNFIWNGFSIKLYLISYNHHFAFNKLESLKMVAYVSEV